MAIAPGTLDPSSTIDRAGLAEKRSCGPKPRTVVRRCRNKPNSAESLHPSYDEMAAAVRHAQDNEQVIMTVMATVIMTNSHVVSFARRALIRLRGQYWCRQIHPKH